MTGEVGGVGLDLAYVSYNYPDKLVAGSDFEEVILGASFGMVGLTYAKNTDDGFYVSAGLNVADFNFTLGYVDLDDPTTVGDDTGYHFDATYNMGDLAFTLSQSSDDGAGYSEEVQFVVSYTFPLDM